MDLQDVRVLITGAYGFVGSALGRFLAEEGAVVFGLVRQREGRDLDPSKPDQNNLIHLTGDIEDPNSLKQALFRTEPDLIFHLAGRSDVAGSFKDPSGFCVTNCLGTTNLLEAARFASCDPRLIFAGSSEEYGFVYSSQVQYEQLKTKYGENIPAPIKIPELPVPEESPLRPVSPYAATKVYGEYLMNCFHQAYGIKTLVARSFNIEGVGRADDYVTTSIARQVVSIRTGRSDLINLGNVTVMRDFTYIKDAVSAYTILAQRGNPGCIYNIGSMRATSIASYLLYALGAAGYQINSCKAIKGDFHMDDPLKSDNRPCFGISFPKTWLDTNILMGKVDLPITAVGLQVDTDRGKISVRFDPDLFRPADNPIIIADNRKIQELGFTPKYEVTDIINEQVQNCLQSQGIS